MKRSVKKYDAQLKAKLALELVSGKKTLIEICTEHKIPKTTLIEWKEKLEKESHDIFLPISERDKKLKQLQNRQGRPSFFEGVNFIVSGG